MRYSALLVLAVIAVVAASGCTVPGLGTISIPGFGGGSTVSAGSGIKIESFEPDFQQIYSTESVQLGLKLRNTGTVDGSVEKVELTGIDWTGATNGGSTGTCGSLKGKMLPAVPDKGITGETKSCTWTVKPKQDEVPDGLSMTYYPTARVTYRYSTSIAKSITVGSSQELRSLQDRGGTLPADTMSSTSGPISIGITSKGPIRVSESGGVEFPIEIKVSNVGGGIVSKSSSSFGSSGSTDWNKMTLTIKLPDGITASEGCDSSNEIALWRGKDNTVGCKLIAQSPGSAGKVQKIITASADYFYIVDATTNIVVTGMKKGTTGTWI
jgi:hypothetical protein